MQIYNYHPVTGEYLSTSEADPSPLEPGVFLIPAHATDIAPPEVATGSGAKFVSGTWIVVPDHRGEVWFDTTGAELVIHALGEVPGGNWTKVAPPLTTEQLAAAARSKRDMRIAAMSWRYERNARETRLGLGTTDNLSDLDTYTQALADITGQVGFPTDILWPVSP